MLRHLGDLRARGRRQVTGEPEKTLFGDTPKGRNVGKGSICRVENQDEVATPLPDQESGAPVAVSGCARGASKSSFLIPFELALYQRLKLRFNKTP